MTPIPPNPLKAELPALLSVVVIYIALGVTCVYWNEPGAFSRTYAIAFAVIAFPMTFYKGKHPLIFGSALAFAGVLGLFL